MAVVVVTDSSSCPDSELAQRYGIHVVPLHVLVGDRTFREGVDDLPDDYNDGTSSTSAASSGELDDCYRTALAASDGDGVVAVHLSRQLSGTWQVGSQVAEPFDEQVRVVDSRAAGMGSGFCALAAARAAQAGASIDDVYNAAVDTAGHARCFVVVDRLDHLRRGGRISTATALLGTALAMKPLLHIVDGKLVLKEKTRTTSKAIAKLIDAAVKEAGAGPAAIAVQHLDAPERADEVAAKLRDRLPHLTELVICELGAVLGVHVGSGAVAVLVVRGGAGQVEP
ncbi:DegV family protein [Antrihabitans cavernicola]|uniref:DegV family protein n=1 Tax=Antrihabitans cavernicola TaxID=2495913 RepID=A0A5A7SEK1_9NOCA|nr:DegV family protein [Spelaeibacter cavernicola]KAA0022955.1 DegV family protein [Spelaeibacter cavernicola]